MIIVFYQIVFGVSLILSLVYGYIYHKHFDVTFTMVFTLCPICCLSYVFLASSTVIEELYVAVKMAYVGGCFLIMFVTLLIMNLCKIKVSPILRTVMMTVSLLVYGSVLTVGKYDLYYTSETTYEVVNGTLRLNKVYGPMHGVFVFMTVVYFLIGFACLIYSHRMKRNISRKIIHLLYLAESIAVLCYIIRIIFNLRVDLLPLSYTIGEFILLLIVYRTGLYDLSDTAIDSLIHTGGTGLISFDFRNNYLGSNETACSYFPELSELTVDSNADGIKFIREAMLTKLHTFSRDEKKDHFFIRRDGKVFRCDINYLYDGRKKRGYQLFVTDDTTEQDHIDLLNKFNTKLNEEVHKKTVHINKMHDKLILGMAAMVESRDNSTGGHIMRTSEGVRILIDEIRKDGKLDLDRVFCRNMIKAAPMHDLGKIAVREYILTKPGRYTPEEFDEMKIHAAEGAKIVARILEGTDDEEFRKVAVNVAHYHHERWDGSGYPEGLKGEQIPLEARIMAIADVYDALVSKRVYKDSMTFEKADSIIMEGMGKHFDQSLQKYYEAARPRLEAYYMSLNEQPGELPSQETGESLKESAAAAKTE